MTEYSQAVDAVDRILGGYFAVALPLVLAAVLVVVVVRLIAWGVRARAAWPGWAERPAPGPRSSSMHRGR